MFCHNYAAIDDSRIQKAKKIISCLEFVINNKLQNKIILEIGTGSGLISYELSKYCLKVISIDLQKKSIVNTISKHKFNLMNNINFFISDGLKLHFKSNSIDIIICNQVIEHIKNKDHYRLIEESYRVLKPRGILYISTPNKYWPIEPHIKLPFLSYLPNNYADKYISLFKDISKYDINLLTYNKIVNIILSKFEIIINLTPIIIKYHERFFNTYKKNKFIKTLSKIIPLFILKLLNPIFPSWILIGIKK